MLAHNSLRLRLILIIILIGTFLYSSTPVRGEGDHPARSSLSASQLTGSAPDFALPYSYRASVYWSSGPHAMFNTDTLGTYNHGDGSGMDFAGTDDPDVNLQQVFPGVTGLTSQNFRVLAMTAGTVVAVNNICSESGSQTYGCWVAVREPAYDTVMIYAHLKPGTIKFSAGAQVGRGTVLAAAGRSGGQSAIHLHIDLHEGYNFTCTAPKDLPDASYPSNPNHCYWGSTLGWEAIETWLDGYMIWGYYQEGSTTIMQNYDGSAVRDLNHTSQRKIIHNFPVTDSGASYSQILVTVALASNFPDIGSLPNPPCHMDSRTNKTTCENNLWMDTQFAGDYGWPGPQGSATLEVFSTTSTSDSPGMLISSNVPSIETGISSSGIQLCDQTNYGSPCVVYTWTANDACINLADSGMDNKADSLRLLGDYTQNFEAVLYGDNACSVYNARYGTDASTLEGLVNQISSMRIEKKTPPPAPAAGHIELYDNTGYGGDVRSYSWTSNDQCIDLNSNGMDNRAESLKFFDWYYGNFDTIFYGDNSCQQYLARYGEETSTFGNLNNQFSSIRIEKHGTLNPNGWIRLCDGIDYSGECRDYRYLNNDRCIDLNLTGMSDRSESIRFFEEYVGNFDVIAYGDNGCQVYNARYGEDNSNFGNLNNQYSSIRIEKHQYLVPDGTIDLYASENYSGSSVSYRYFSDGHCYDLASTSMDNQAESLRFRNGYISEFDVIFYGDNACQTYNARYGQDATTFGNLNNQFSSMRIEHHGPIMPDLVPASRDGVVDPIIISTSPDTSTNDPLTSGQPFYVDWGHKNIGSYPAGDAYVDLYIDDQRFIHYPFSGLAGGSWNGFDDWMISDTIQPGWHWVRLIVDPEKTVSEANETNNEWQKLFYWQAEDSVQSTYFAYLPLIMKNYQPTTTVTVYSQLEDGEALYSDCSLGWTACRNSATGSGSWDDLGAITIGSDYSSGNYTIQRAFLYFNTSSIPSGATIVSSTLHLYAGQWQNGIKTVHIVRSTAGLPLTGSDYGKITFQSGGSITFPEPFNWVGIDLNETALSWFVGGGITKLALIHDYDMMNTVPTSSNNVILASADDEVHRPYLVVAYFIP